MMRRVHLLGLAILVGLAGCQATKAPESEKGDAAPKETSTKAAPVPEPKVTAAMVPDSLKTKAYSYYGLGNTKKMLYEMVQGTETPIDGSQTVSLKAVEGSKAVFEIERVGLVGEGGTDTIELRPDGVWAVGSSQGKFDNPSLDLPARCDPGSSWTVRSQITPTGQAATKIEGMAQVVGIEKVKVPAGTYDALVVSLKAEMTAGSVKAKIDGKTWYVKDLGMVQQSLVRTLQGQSLKIVMRLKQIGT